MMEELAVLANNIQAGMLLGFVVFLRVGAVLALLPAFGEQMIPARLRLMLALSFTAIVTPAIAPVIAMANPSGIFQPLWLPSEVIAGLALGISFRLFILALQTGGAIIAQSTSLSQIFGSGGVEPAPAIGHLLMISGLTLAVMSGLHVRAAEAMILSYDVLPVGQFPNAGVLSEWGVGRVARAFSLAFILALPFVIASLIYNVALGVINRAMPQLMVAFVGAPAITAGGLILLFLTMPFLLPVWGDAFVEFLGNPFGGN